MTFTSLISRVLLALIRLYQLTLSPFIGRSCRFEPSCSRYTAACIELHGPGSGVWLGMQRLARCHPFHVGGFDPPPLSIARAPHAALRPPSSRNAAPSAALTAGGTPTSESSCTTDCRAHGCSR